MTFKMNIQGYYQEISERAKIQYDKEVINVYCHCYFKKEGIVKLCLVF